MNCPVCGTRFDKGWTFCPRCGSRISGDFFEEIFSRMRKELAEMNKLLEKDIEAFDLSPWFRDMEKKKAFVQPKGSGFSIKIIHSGSKEPEVSFRTFGDVDRSKLQKEMKGLGIMEGHGHPSAGKPQEPKVVIKDSMRTEEPRTSVARSAAKVVVDMEMPGVRSDGDIEVSELESSVEVKALAGDKAYFKILTKPSQFRMSRKNFSKGVLHMEFS
jgi:HSP20 family molecular chaperone IbpA